MREKTRKEKGKEINKVIVSLAIISATVGICFSGYSLLASKSELQLVEKQVIKVETELDILRKEIREDLRVIRTDVKSLLRVVGKSCCALE